jgi:tRNA(Ile)-lysidine synthase
LKDRKVPVRKRLTPAQGLVRHELRQCLVRHLTPGQKVLVAVSGGADSLALAAATEFEARKLNLKIAAAVIDHGLQKNSDRVAAQAAKQLTAIGFEEIYIERVKVSNKGGMEAAAREARYLALESIRAKSKSKFILLGHTFSDQAETVLLGLVRGSGAKSLSGMSEKTHLLLRPLLAIERKTTEQFCRDSGIKFWNDPQNKDEKFLRVLVRTQVLPFLEKVLGGSVAKSLVRTADQLRDDSQFLDAEATKKYRNLAKRSGSSMSFDALKLSKLPPAISNRVIKMALDSFGKESSRTHVLAVNELVLNWHGQKPLTLPGVRVGRKANTITFTPSGAASGSGNRNR